jgi:pimeloyl-ACP methyl ester carboxylesterase
MSDATTIDMPDGRTLGFADYGPADATPVLWFHGGPGSRLEPKPTAPAAAALGQRLIGIDRPGYGLSTPRPGRSIAACVPDALAVADHLGLDRFYTVGVSTGGAYALATAAIAADRVRGVVACCALTDLRNAEVKAQMVAMTEWSKIFEATTRDQALELAAGQFGEDGAKMLEPNELGIELPAADAAVFADPAFLAAMVENFPAMFAFGVEGYADDRLADGPGWGSFDIELVSCPVIVAHGTADVVCPPINAETTAKVVPNAQLRWFEGDGHFSVVRHIPELVAELQA